MRPLAFFLIGLAIVAALTIAPYLIALRDAAHSLSL